MADFIGMNAPGWVAKLLRGKREGQQIAYDRAADERERALREEQIGRQLSAQDYAMTRQKRREPLEDKLLQFEMDEVAAQAAERKARAQGTGAYAPRPEKPRWQRVVTPSGEVVVWDPDSGETREAPVKSRVPGRPKPSKPNRDQWVANRAIVLKRQLVPGPSYLPRKPVYSSLAEAKAAAEREYDELYGSPQPTGGVPVPFGGGVMRPGSSVSSAPDQEEEDEDDPDFEELRRTYEAGRRP